MKFVVARLWCGAFFFLCLSQPIIAADFQQLFGNDKSLTVYVFDKTNEQTHTHNPERADQRFTPYSTFKIPNSLIALETGAVSSLDEVFTYNPELHASTLRQGKQYHRDQTLSSAFEFSVLWVYQEIAQRIGHENYQQYLELFGYGNRNVSGSVTHFWLDELKISAEEQVKFLSGLYDNTFEFRQATIDDVKHIMLSEETSDYRLYTKTGTGKVNDTSWLGWLVGYVESGERIVFFAINADAPSYTELKKRRQQILRQSLAHLDIMLAGY